MILLQWYKFDNFSDIEQVSIDLSIKHKNDPYIRFRSIGYNDNISHSVADGGYWKYTIDNILDDKNINIPSRFPYGLQDVLKEEYDKAPSDIPFWGENEKVNGIPSNFPSELLQTKDVSYSTARIPSKMLQCYDSRNKTLHSFTNSL